ncbi:hypothetical protein QCM79_42990, partial [Bradyrhizobium sp. SSUT77]|nr:hypothetical protein [Bradyrhizobium sp. SSUT77]
MDPFNNLNQFEGPDVEWTYYDGLEQQQADQAGFQQHLNANPLRMPDEDRVGQGTSRWLSDPPAYSEQGLNQHMLFAAADRAGQLPAGNFGLTDRWHGMDAAADWPTHSVDQEERSWAEVGDVVPGWPTTSEIPWEQNLGASILGREPRPGDGDTSRGGRRLTPAAAQWTETLYGTRASGPASLPTDLEDPVLRQSRLDQILDTWAGEEGQTEDEDRQEAVRRMRACGEAGDGYVGLELLNLGLTTLPAALPPGLQSLNVSDNELVHLPDT